MYDVGADAGNDDIPTNCRKSHEREREGPKGKEEKKKRRVGVALIASLQVKPLPNIILMFNARELMVMMVMIVIIIII